MLWILEIHCGRDETRSPGQFTQYLKEEDEKNYAKIKIIRVIYVILISF